MSQHSRGDPRHWEQSYNSNSGLETCLLSNGATSLLNSHKSNEKINKLSSSDFIIPFNGLLTYLEAIVFIRALCTSKPVATAKKKTEVRWEKRQWQVSSKACNSLTPNPRCELANSNKLLLKRLSFFKCMCSNPSYSQGSQHRFNFSTSPDLNTSKGWSRSLGNRVINRKRSAGGQSEWEGFLKMRGSGNSTYVTVTCF